MKIKSVLSLGLALALLLIGSVSFASSGDIDLASILREIPQEQRKKVVLSILQMVKEVDGIDALNSIYQSAAEEIPSNSMNSSTPTLDSEDKPLDVLLSEQPLVVIKTEVLPGDERWKSIYPDILSAVIQNNSDHDIKNAVVGFVAWDKNNLPIKIESQFDFGSGSYFKKVNYKDINLVPSDTFGNDYGLSLGENCVIETCKAIIVSYETFEGYVWENPYLEDFRELYEGKKLREI